MKSFFTKKHLAVVLCAFLFTLLNRLVQLYPRISPEQQIIAESTQYRKWLRSAGSAADLADLSRNFLLINVTHDADVYCDPVAGSKICPDPSVKKVTPCFPTISRERLTDLFKWLLENEGSYNQIVCDITFSDRDPSRPDTGLLENYLSTLQAHGKIIFAGEYDEKLKKFSVSRFSEVEDPANIGSTNEDRTDGLFFTYRLSYNDAAVSSLPLLLYQRTHNCRVSQNWLGFLRCEDSVTGRVVRGANVFIPEMIFEPKDIDKLRSLYGNESPDTSIAMLDLWQALLPCGPFRQFYLRRALDSASVVKRTVFIGSFSHDHPDMHKTLYGDLDGAVILLNIYYSLLKHQNSDDVWYLLFLYACFYGVFYRLLIRPHSPLHVRNKIVQHGIVWFWDELHYFILVFMTVMANVFFGKVTNIIILAGVFFIIDKVHFFYREHRAGALPAGSSHS